MSRPLPIALAQVPGRSSNDLDGFGSHAAQVLSDFPQTRLLVYPELHLGDDATSDAHLVYESAEPLRDGPRHRALSRLAAELGIWLCPGSVAERGEAGRLYNTAVVYSPQGELIGAYRKVFPWRPYERWTPGTEFVVVDLVDLGRIGLSICYDAWFPESSRHLAWQGAELIVNVVKTPTADRTQETVLARANAIVNQVFVASVNGATPSGVGRSLIVDPEGRTVVDTPGDSTTVLTAVLDLDAVQSVRTHGTLGLTRVWDQFQSDDEPLPLPLYGGRIDPAVWRPQSPDPTEAAGH